MASENKSKAVIAISGELGSSVKAAFGGAGSEVKKLGAAMRGLQNDQSLVVAAKRQEHAVKEAESHLNRLISLQKKASAGGTVKEQRQLERDVKAAAKAVDQEYKALQKCDDELELNGIDASKLSQEERRLGDAIAHTDSKLSRSEKWGAVKNAVGGVGSALRSLGIQFGIAAGAASYFFKTQLLNTASEMETLKARLRTVSNSSMEAKGAWDWLKTFEPKTPFEIDKVTDAFIYLKNFGIDPVKTGLLDTLGNTAASRGEKDMGNAVKALTSAMSGRNVMLQKYGILVKAAGKGSETFEWTDKSGEKHAKTISKNKELIQSTIQTIWNEKYGTAMGERLHTWEGMMSSLGSQWKLFKMEIMDAGLFDFMKGKLSSLLDKISEMRKSGELAYWARKSGSAIRDFGKWSWDTGKAIKSFFDWTWPLIESIGGINTVLLTMAGIQLLPLGTAVVKLGVALWGLDAAAWAAAAPLAGILVTVTALGAACYEVAKNATDMAEALNLSSSKAEFVKQGQRETEEFKKHKGQTPDVPAQGFRGWFRGMDHNPLYDQPQSSTKNKTSATHKTQTNTFHINVYATPGQDARQVADNTTRLMREHPELVGGWLTA